jgi:signal transduction histidine kinase
MDDTLKKIEVLFIEDNPDDVELELYELRKGGFDVTHHVARNREQFLASLENLNADIIIADYSLPNLTGIEAIHLLQEKNIKIPVILITGMGNEQVAVDSLREGAIDYILKKNIAGFAARVSRALDIWADRQAIETVEAEKKKLQQQLFQSQKMESVGRLAGGIAHDFNNLLTGIMGYASLSLKSLPEGTPVSKNIQTIIDVSKRASHLVKQLLLFSRKIPLDFKLLDINRMVEENVGFIRRMVEETVDIELDLAQDLPMLKSDQGQLTQVLMNFAINARDAMQGKGVITIKTEKVTSDSKLVANNPAPGVKEYIIISVSDTGCGIDKEDQPKIFDPFFTTKEVGKGTGLGLAIVYSIIIGHGGWVDVQSVKGEGSTFRVFLPVVLDGGAAEGESVEADAQQQDSYRQMISGKETILIVEDEEVLRSFSFEMLKDLGYEVLTASNGEEALTVFAENHEVINLVVSDMIMPKKSGVELFSELKEMKPEVKFILVTGYCLEEAEGHVLRNMSAIMMKPYTTEKIAALIRKVLDE